MVVNCQHVWEEVSNYLDGEVDAELRAAMEAHFALCKHCTAVLDGARNVVQLYGDDRLFELPAGFSRRLQHRLDAESGSSFFHGLHSFWMLAVAAVALIAGALVFGNSSVFAHPETRSRLAQPAHRIPPQLKVVVSSEGRLFHVPGCRYLHNKVGETPEPMTASQAMRDGYAPCPRCLRQYLSATVECPRPAPKSEASVVQLDARTRSLQGMIPATGVRTRASHPRTRVRIGASRQRCRLSASKSRTFRTALLSKSPQGCWSWMD